MAASNLTKAKSQLVLQEPFYATILLNLKEHLVEKTPDGRDLWMAATNGTDLFINPVNIEKLPIAQIKGVLKHEVMHVAQLHPWRGEGKEGRRWNHATDYVINPMIIDEGGELPPNCLDGTVYKGQTAEKVYSQLPPEPPGGGGGGRGQGGANGGNPLDDDVMPAKDKSQAGEEAAKVMIASAAAVAKSMGKLPAALKELVDEIMNPKIDWKEALRRWLTESSPTDYSFRRPNRRFISGDSPMYLPGIDGTDSMNKLGVLIDTSGSVGMEELKQMLGEVAGAVADVAPKGLVVAYCDAKVDHHDVFDQPTDAQVRETLQRHGGGGTNMPAGLTWFKRKFPDVQSVFVLTDGYTPWGEEDDYPFPVLWAVTTPGLVAPWGETIQLDLD